MNICRPLRDVVADICHFWYELYHIKFYWRGVFQNAWGCGLSSAVLGSSSIRDVMLWVQSQAPNKPGVVVPLYDHSNWEVEEGGSSST